MSIFFFFFFLLKILIFEISKQFKKAGFLKKKNTNIICQDHQNNSKASESEKFINQWLSKGTVPQV